MLSGIKCIDVESLLDEVDGSHLDLGDIQKSRVTTYFHYLTTRVRGPQDYERRPYVGLTMGSQPLKNTWK